MSTGLAFFLLQIIAIAFYETNNLIITHFIGPDEVTVYNVAYKYMQVLMMVFTILIAPFWSAFAEANINGDFVWMRSTVKTLVRFVAALGLLGLAMVAVSPLFYRVWLQGQVEVPILITLLVFLFHIANIWSTLWTQLLCGFGKIRLQMLMSTLCCLFYLPAAIFGCRYFGLAGLLCASVLSFAVFTSWFGVMQVHKLINRTAKGIWNK
jgi:O-antigen/teichoic acid export membrane protein